MNHHLPKLQLSVQPKFWFCDSVRVEIPEPHLDAGQIYVGTICGLDCVASENVLDENCHFYWQYRIQFFDTSAWFSEKCLILSGNKPTVNTSELV